MPVKTMAMPWVLATAMDSSSRTLPPGWEIAVTPAAANAETVSPKGKKASLAATEPVALSPARLIARRAASTRFG